MRTIANLPLISGATGATVSPEFINNQCDILSLQVSGTFSAVSLTVQGVTSTSGSEWTNIAAVDLSNFDIKNPITAEGIYETGIEGISKVRVNVTSVTGGSVSVFAKFANTAGE